MLQPLNDNTNGVEQRHLGLCMLNLLDQSHQAVQYYWRVWKEVVSMEFPLVGNFLELAASGNSDDLIVEWIALVHEMLENLVDNRLLLFCNFDGYPLRDDDSDATSDDIVARFLFACFGDQSVFQERVKVDLIVQHICSQPDGGIDGVFE
jgi:hypothetical protein